MKPGSNASPVMSALVCRANRQAHKSARSSQADPYAETAEMAEMALFRTLVDDLAPAARSAAAALIGDRQLGDEMAVEAFAELNRVRSLADEDAGRVYVFRAILRRVHWRTGLRELARAVQHNLHLNGRPSSGRSTTERLLDLPIHSPRRWFFVKWLNCRWRQSAKSCTQMSQQHAGFF